MVLGLGGLANGWRAAARLWGWSGVPGEALALLTAAAWTLLLALYVGKWVWRPRAPLAELRHPIQSSFVALAPIATAIASLAAAPVLPEIAWVLMIAGARARRPSRSIPSPRSGGASATPRPRRRRSTSRSWVAAWSAPSPPAPSGTRTGPRCSSAPACCPGSPWSPSPLPDIAAQALFGYALLHAMVGLRLRLWLRRQPFGTPYWAYTFGLSALPLAALRLVECG